MLTRKCAILRRISNRIAVLNIYIPLCILRRETNKIACERLTGKMYLMNKGFPTNIQRLLDFELEEGGGVFQDEISENKAWQFSELLRRCEMWEFLSVERCSWIRVTACH